MNDELKITDCYYSYDEKDKDNCISLMGGDTSNPSWEEYLNRYKDEYKPHFVLIKNAIEENGWVGMTGEEMQNENIQFQFSDGKAIGFSWRAWGDLMQAIVNKKEGYMKYYM